MTTDRKPDGQTAERHLTAGTATATGSTIAGAAATGSTIDGGAGTDHSGQPTTAGCATAARLSQEANDSLHNCDRSARYHVARRAFFDQCHRWMMVAVLISGSAAVVALSGENKILSVSIMLLPAVFGAISVVFSLTDRARDHEMLARKFYQIAVTIDPEHATAERVQRWRISILGVYEDEPAVYHALNAECYNAAAQALGKKERQQVREWQHWLRHWCRFSAKDFPKIMIEAPI